MQATIHWIFDEYLPLLDNEPRPAPGGTGATWPGEMILARDARRLNRLLDGSSGPATREYGTSQLCFALKVPSQFTLLRRPICYL